MTHEITKTDTMLVAGQPAWHGIGTVLPGRFLTQEALTIGGLDWHVHKTQLHMHWRYGMPPLASEGQRFTHRKPTQAYATVRRLPGYLESPEDPDQQEILGIVGSGYEVLQNSQLAEYVRRTCGAAVEIESAGSLRGGRDVFFLAALEAFDAAPGDEVKPYALFSNTHDGTRAFRVLPTSVRVVCSNTLNAAVRANVGISIRHTASLLDTIEDAQMALQQSIAAGFNLKVKAQAMAKTPISGPELKRFFVDVYTKAYGAIPVGASDATEERKLRRATALVADWVQIFEQPQNRIGGTHVWGALNAVTQWADHDRKASDRLHSNLFGSSADFKANAMAQAMEFVG